MVSDQIPHVCTLWLLASIFFVITLVSSPATNNSLEIVDLKKTSNNDRTSRSYLSTYHSNEINKDIYINDKPEANHIDSSKVQYRIRRGLRQVIEDSTTDESMGEEQTIINNEEYYTYDYYADAVEEENLATRNKRSSAVLFDESNSEFLLKLAEMVGSFDSKYIPNFTTPNPNIEITIEVINGVDHEEEIYSNHGNEIGSWGEWTPCSVSCGHGLKQRSRSCDSLSCAASETQECDFHPCPETTSVEIPSSSAAVITEEKDSCEEWMACKDQLTPYFEGLPTCPCSYPRSFSNAIWDKETEKWFNWEDASRKDDHLEIFKPTARYCIRSLHSEHTTSSASQQCCYNDNLKLITRGPGAGTPQLISSNVSPELHYKIDILPWIICKGDWTKYNQVRPPNNKAGCREFPNDSDMRYYVKQATDF